MLGAGAVAAVGLGAGGLGVAQSLRGDDYAAAAEMLRARLSEHPELKDFIRLATLAPNGHNTQPWRFRLGSNRIDIRPDFARRTPVVDPDDHHLFVSLGCAAENLSIAAAAGGHHGEARFDPAGEGALVFDYTDGPVETPPLLKAITERQSTRNDYDGRPFAADTLRALEAAAAVPGIDLLLLTDPARIGQVLDLVLAGNSAQMADPAFTRELKSWLRFSPRQALASGDGLYSAASGSPTAPAWLGGLLFDMLFSAASENDKYARQIRSSAGLAVFVSATADHDHWTKAGRSAQRFALQATALGVKHCFINQPVEVPAVRQQLAALLGLGDRRPDLVMRFGYGAEMPKSLRRPVAAVLDA